MGRGAVNNLLLALSVHSSHLTTITMLTTTTTTSSSSPLELSSSAYLPTFTLTHFAFLPVCLFACLPKMTQKQSAPQSNTPASPPQKKPAPQSRTLS
ncbi:hypothetical protein DFP73DRAFT_318359 [Morchella snyderi]|nr:hypothetical protein DFP73DRAFT_318359 [Morchella snyderi]